ncbi:VOC family protein [Rhodoplanes sp. SY1]|uniref:VOC family protein n=1 Tax=Rhodoplanes sp. SY1 TaxID=3166646 RepID=UPI0038B434F1
MTRPTTPSTVVPALRYRDAPAMIDWLCAVLGFTRHAVYEDGAGGIAHAQLTLGGGMVMLGTARDDDFGKLQSTPAALGGCSQSPYVVVADADAVHARAVAHGAEIVMPLRDESHGGRGVSFRDPEGHLWNVGTYDPWATS